MGLVMYYLADRERPAFIEYNGDHTAPAAERSSENEIRRCPDPRVGEDISVGGG